MGEVSQAGNRDGDHEKWTVSKLFLRDQLPFCE